MKRTIGFLLFIMMLFTAVPAFANSGPVYWEGFPGTETMAVIEPPRSTVPPWVWAASALVVGLSAAAMLVL